MAALSTNWQTLIKTQKVTRKRQREEPTSHSKVDRAAPSKAASMVLRATEVKTPANAVVTKFLAMDCEMVGVGPEGTESSLARCSIVNFDGHVVYDKFIRQTQKVTDYRTHVSGIESHHLTCKHAIAYKQCQKEVADMIKDRILIGHSLQHDLKCLMLSHPMTHIRDTAYHKPLCPHRPRALKKLCEEHLEVKIQDGQHDSVQDARSVLALYKKFRNDWEKRILASRKKKAAVAEKKAAKAQKQSEPQDAEPEPSETKRQRTVAPYKQKIIQNRKKSSKKA